MAQARASFIIGSLTTPDHHTNLALLVHYALDRLFDKDIQEDEQTTDDVVAIGGAGLIGRSNSIC